MIKTKSFTEFSLWQNFEEKSNKKDKSYKHNFLDKAYSYWEESYYLLIFLKNLENCVVATIIYLLKQAVKYAYSQLKSILYSDS